MLASQKCVYFVGLSNVGLVDSDILVNRLFIAFGTHTRVRCATEWGNCLHSPPVRIQMGVNGHNLIWCNEVVGLSKNVSASAWRSKDDRTGYMATALHDRIQGLTNHTNDVTISRIWCTLLLEYSDCLSKVLSNDFNHVITVLYSVTNASAVRIFPVL